MSIKASRESYHDKLPDLELLFKYELSACSQEEIVSLCQELIESGMLDQFDHPIRRTAYDLAAAGVVTGVVVPPGYVSMNNEDDRETILNVTAH